MQHCLTILLVLSTIGIVWANGDPKVYRPVRCELVPLPNHQVSFRIDGMEMTRWHYGPDYPRPFFYPFNGPSGVSLTRMGHPGASDHDHHRSVWFAFHKVNDDLNFWADGTGTQIRQKQWFAYKDGDDEAIMACALGYFDKEGAEVMEQTTVAAIRPGVDGYELELQISLHPPENLETVELRKTNFGPLAVRVAKSLSEHFGGGQLTNSEGALGEPDIFGKPARWVDYSGPVVVGSGQERNISKEGITYIDHPTNLRHPTKWHVRSDGWMGASVCMDTGITMTAEKPLVLRYLLIAHSGGCDAALANASAKAFAERPLFEVGKRRTKHRPWEVWRKTVERE
ncbi:MAG: PmoA family protein [Verrucomicrobiales bacterium]|jgi:hypothetical protein|nr:PmoA family protein [Verrucomicrobiales bacterium]MDA7644497.1 PmoA family protein [Verrucomicrobiales bacterium]MDF1787693.1 PmoA family protein [Verrucomicrobiales bacterium]